MRNDDWAFSLALFTVLSVFYSKQSCFMYIMIGRFSGVSLLLPIFADGKVSSLLTGRTWQKPKRTTGRVQLLSAFTPSQGYSLNVEKFTEIYSNFDRQASELENYKPVFSWLHFLLSIRTSQVNEIELIREQPIYSDIQAKKVKAPLWRVPGYSQFIG